MMMRKLNKFFEKGLIISFISIIIFTSGYLISLTVIPFLHHTINPPHLQIFIRNDSDFEKYNFPGSGTESDPYLIENLTSLKQGLSEIDIYGVSKYFIIMNNIIISERSEEVIRIGNVPVNISIINNAIYGSAYMHDLQAGISIYNLNECKIINNTVISKEKGIQVRNSSYCSLQNNKLIKNGRPIDIKDSFQIVIENNYLVYDEGLSGYTSNDAVHVENSDYVSVRGNQIYEGWLFFNDNSIKTTTIEDNYINGVKIGVFKNLTDFSLNSTTEFAQLLLIDCTNCSLYNLNVSDVNIAIGIYQSSYINCSNCNLSNNSYAGLYIYDSVNITIFKSTFFNNDVGTRVKYSDVQFSNNAFQTNLVGIYKSNSNCSFVNNSFIDNIYDIYTYDF
jgi:parallel beta-helix repeat protein